MRAFFLHFFVVASVISAMSTTSQASLIFNSNVRAEFKFTAFEGNPLGLPTGLVLDFIANGALTFSLDDSVTNASSMAFLDATGDSTVSAPAGFEGATMRPFLFDSGQLTSIARDSGGNITGGNVSELRMLLEMNLGATRLYTKDSLPFNGAVAGAPFQIGNQIVGQAPFDVFLDTGLGNPGQIGGEPLAVMGSDRFLTITTAPEPSSLALLGLSGNALAFRLRSRRSLNPTQRIPDLGDSSNGAVTKYTCNPHTCNLPSHSRI